MIKASEAAMIACIAEAREENKISVEMKEFISNQIVKAATRGQTRTGFIFGGDEEYCFAVAKWAISFGYSVWFDNSRKPAILWLGWNMSASKQNTKNQ